MEAEILQNVLQMILHNKDTDEIWLQQYLDYLFKIYMTRQAKRDLIKTLRQADMIR